MTDIIPSHFYAYQLDAANSDFLQEEKRTLHESREKKLDARAVRLCRGREETARPVCRIIRPERHAGACTVLLHVPARVPVRGWKCDGGRCDPVVPAVAGRLCWEDPTVQPVHRHFARHGLHNPGRAPAAAGRPVSARAARRRGIARHRRDQEHDGG